MELNCGNLLSRSNLTLAALPTVVCFLTLTISISAAPIGVVAIGISGYPKYPEAPLKYADRDAIGFQAIFDSVYGSSAPVHTLTNEEATREAIIDAFRTLRANPPDNLFVFFSGHAEVESSTSRLFLMPYMGDKSDVDATGLPMEEFMTQVRTVGAHHTILFLDACHSGAAIGKGSPTQSAVGATLAETLSALNQQFGANIIEFVSSSAEEVSSEDEEYQQGLFTHFVLKGLQGEADTSADGRVTAGELKKYLDKQVPERARVLGRGPQTPLVSGSLPDDFTMLIYRQSPASVSTAKTQEVKLSTEGKAKLSDPHFKLLLQVTNAPNVAPYQEGLGTEALLLAMNDARSRKPLDGTRVMGLESAVCLAFGAHGDTLLTVTEQASLNKIDLHTGKLLDILILRPPARSIKDARLDSCNISVSRDDSYAVVAMQSFKNVEKVDLVSLGSAKAPPISTNNESTGTFGADILALGEGNTLHVFRTDNWSEIYTLPMPGISRIVRLSSEPDSNIILIEDEHGLTQVVRVDPISNSVSILKSNRSGTCVALKRSAFCWQNGRLDITDDNGVGELGFPCGPGGCRLFPSAASSLRESFWALMFQGLTEPNVLRFGGHHNYPLGGSFKISAIVLDEPIAAGKLFADGSVVAISKGGAVYRFNASAFVDCCEVTRRPLSQMAHVAAGDGDVTAILTAASQSGGTIGIWEANTQIQSIPRTESVTWVRGMRFWDSNRLLVLVGEKQIEVLELTQSFSLTGRAHKFYCGAPYNLIPSTSELACFAGGDDGIRIYSMTTDRVKSELKGHVGPLQAISMTPRFTWAAGALGRPAATISMWDASGKLFSKTCMTNGVSAPKSVTLLDGGASLLEIDAESLLVLRDTLSCESKSLNGFIPANPEVLVTNSEKVLVHVPKAPDLIRLTLPSLGNRMSVDVEDPIDEMSLAADGEHAVLLTSEHIFRIPLTVNSASRLASRQLEKEFSAADCRRYFVAGNCPLLPEAGRK